MIDLEKVIKRLEWILENDRFGFGVNWETGEPRDDYEKAGKIITDTIALLKEQEAKSVIVTTNAYGTKFYHCPRCNRDLYVYPRQLYCSNCGQELNWK